MAVAAVAAAISDRSAKTCIQAFGMPPKIGAYLRVSLEKEPAVAQKKHVMLIDDVDGSPAAETVRFALDGAEYEVDLNEAHAEALRESFAEWIGSARKVSGRRTTVGRRSRSSPTTASPSTPDNATVRQWARQNGYTVSDRGRIPTNVREAYELAN